MMIFPRIYYNLPMIRYSFEKRDFAITQMAPALSPQE